MILGPARPKGYRDKIEREYTGIPQRKSERQELKGLVAALGADIHEED